MMKSTSTLSTLNSTKVNARPTSGAMVRVVAMRAGMAALGLALAACGGGGNASPASDVTISLATVTTNNASKPVSTTTSTPSTPVSSNSIPVGAVITNVRMQNTGAAQTNVPFTFGQVFAAGQLMPTDGLAAKLADGTVLRLQTDVKATHADGSVRHAIVSGVLPSLAGGQTLKLDLAKSSASETGTATPQSLLSAGLTGNVTINLNNVKYTASLTDALANVTPTKWLSGTTVNEWFFNAPLKTAAGAAHPMLTARFGVRWYSGLTKQARIEIVIENDKTFTGPASSYTYDVDLNLGGKSAYSKTGLTHYHHARWHQYAWWDASSQPAVNVQLNTAYLIASKAVSNYDQSVVIPESILAGMASSLNPGNTGPMSIGTTMAYMGTTGGRGDIGPLPDYAVNYLLTMDKRAKDVMMANADGSGSWSMHYRDENTDYPVRTDNPANARISTHMNLSWTGPLPVPRCVSDSACSTPYAEDVAHLPSLTYLPYLVSGDYYYLEELQFWAASNPLGTDPGFNGVGQGLLRWHQARGQAWALRTLGHAAYITPDASPMKAYFTKQVDNNLNFYHQTYVVGNPNKLGVYDGSGEGSFQVAGSAPWQDDFFTWSFGYLNELGFTKALPILQWKAKYPVGRMTTEGYCWVMASPYALKFRDNSNSPIYDSFAQLYQANYGGATIANDNAANVAGPAGVKFSDLPCGSQAQSDYLGVINGYGWTLGRMVGYADSVLGYTANMQPALAVAADAGVNNAAKAWSVFNARAAKPNYSQNPQWDIIPR